MCLAITECHENYLALVIRTITGSLYVEFIFEPPENKKLVSVIGKASGEHAGYGTSGLRVEVNIQFHFLAKT